MKKRVLSLCLCIVLVLSALPATALAANAYPEGFSMWGDRLSGYTGPGGDVVIPDGVTSIEPKAFYNRSDITGVTIPDSVTAIYDSAFQGCTGLTDVTIPGALTFMGRHAFEGCTSLTDVTIPDAVTQLGDFAFANCTALRSVTISSGLGRWESSHTFQNCTALTDVAIPAGVTRVGEAAFQGCAGLTALPGLETVKEIGRKAFQGCTGLTELTFPDSVAKIGDKAFDGCTALTKVELPAGVDLGFDPFSNCPALAELRIDPANSIFRDDAYSDKGYTPHAIGPFVIADGAVRKYTGSADRVVIPEGITRVDGFQNSKVREVVLPDTVKEICPGAFQECRELTTVHFPDGLTSIGASAFLNCSSLTQIDLPDSVTDIDGAFSKCTSLSKVTLGRGITEENLPGFDESPITQASSPYPMVEAKLLGCQIENGVLTQYTGLVTDVVIPEGVTAIGERAFFYCNGLTSVTIPDTVTSIGAEAFSGQTGLTNVTIPDSVTRIGYQAFYNCTGLKRVKVGSGVTQVDGPSVFQGCTALKNLELPSQLPFLAGARLRGFEISDGNVVMGYYGLTDGNVVIPEGVLKVSSLPKTITTVTYPSTLTTISSLPEHLRDAYIPASVTAVEGHEWSWKLTIHGAAGSYAETFAKANKLKFEADMDWQTSDSAMEHQFIIDEGVLFKYNGPGGHVVIPDGVIAVDRYAFSDRLTVTGLTIPSSVVYLQLDCPNVEELFIPKSVKDGGDGIFCVGRKKVEFEQGSPLFHGFNFAFHEYGLVSDTRDLQEIVNNPIRTWENHIAANRTIREAWKDPYADIGTPTPRVIALSNEICAGLTTNKEKAKAISMWVVGNVEYDYDYYYAGLKTYYDVPFDPDTILDKGLAVCAGYARLTQALMNAQGIPCLYVMGWTPNGLHAWNLALVDGEYLYYDTTWGEYYTGVGEACISLQHIPTGGAATFDNVKGPGTIISVSIDPETRRNLASEIGYDPYMYIPPSTNPTNTEGESVDPSQLSAATEETNQIDQSAVDPTLSDWAQAEVSAAQSAGLVPDDLQSNYTWYLTRQEFCRLMIKLVELRAGMGIDQVLASRSLSLADPFSDTHLSEVRAAYALGIVKGTGGDIFNPYGSITRQEAATMLERTARVLGISGGQGETFADADTFPDWAREGIAFTSGLVDATSGNKVMQGTGDGYFSPLMTYSREQGIVTALRMFQTAK